MKKRSLCYGSLLSALILGGAGCTVFSNVGLRIQRDPDIRDVAIQVDVIGITEADKSAWAGTNVTKYWAQVMDGKDKAKVLQFNPGEKGSQGMKTSPKNIDYLVVVSDYPTVPAGKDPGSSDPRLCVIPLNKYKHSMWTGTITVKIHKWGIQPTQ